MPERTTKINNARYVVTMDPERRIIADGTIVISGTQITQVGKSDDLAHVSADTVLEAEGMVVTPGFVNGHMHISYAHAVRGLFPDNLGADYLPNVFRLQAAMTPEDEYSTSLLAITELLKYGTTTFVDPGTTTHLDVCLDAYRQAGCRIVVGWNVLDRPNPLNLPIYETDDAIRLTQETVDRYHGALDGLVSAWAMPFSSEFCSADLLRATHAIAESAGTRSTLHFNSGPRWIQHCQQEHGCTPTEYLDRCGVLTPAMTLAHCLGISDDEAQLIGERGAAVVMCPTAAIKGGARMTHQGLLPELIKYGAVVGLGTDAGNNSNLLETLRSVYLAAVLYKDGRGDVGIVPAETALELGTIGGAAALGMDDIIGSVEPGKAADLVLFDTRRSEWAALHNPVNSLVYNADGRSVHTVIVNGRVVVQNHHPLFVDEAELVAQVQKSGAALIERAAVNFDSRWPIV